MKHPILAAALAALSILPLDAAQATFASADNLKQMDLEDLFQVKVISATRIPQELQSTPAAISILTNAQIPRTGATNLPDALRFAPGLQVSRFNASSYAITARGFSSNAGAKMQVISDGRTLYTPLFAGVFWEYQDPPLADIERIEVVRGPGATLFGPNAVNGVINIVSRPADQTQGLRVGFAAGNEERSVFGFRYGGKLGERTFYRAYLRQHARDELATASGAPAGDGTRHLQGGFRTDTPLLNGGLTVIGDIWRNSFGIAGRGDASNDGGDVNVTWSTDLGGNRGLQLRGIYDRNHRVVPLQFTEIRDSFEFDAQYHFPVGGVHDVVMGANYRHSADQTGTASNLTFRFNPANQTVRPVTAFIQDQITLVPRKFSLYAGSKFEWNDYTGFEFQPSLRASWTPTDRQTVWTGVSRAVRRPTRVDTDTVFIPNPANGLVVIRGNPNFQGEELTAFEVGYRMVSHVNLNLDISTYYNKYDRLRTIEPTPVTVLPFTTGNLRDGNTYGVEISAVWEPTTWWRLSGSFNQMNESLPFKPASRDSTGGSSETNDPKKTATLMSGFTFGNGLQLDLNARHVSALPNPAVPAYTALDVRLVWQINERYRAGLVGQNLLDPSHPEFGAAPARAEIQRGFYFQFSMAR